MAEGFLSWDSEILNDGMDFVLLPDGDYDFTVTKFERGVNGGTKYNGAKEALLELTVDCEEGKTVIKEKLTLHTAFEWKLSAFFRSIGMKKHGEKLVMNWEKVTGAKGRAHIVTDEFNGRNGGKIKINKIDKYYDAEAALTQKDLDDCPF